MAGCVPSPDPAYHMVLSDQGGQAKTLLEFQHKISEIRWPCAPVCSHLGEGLRRENLSLEVRFVSS